MQPAHDTERIIRCIEQLETLYESMRQTVGLKVLRDLIMPTHARFLVELQKQHGFSVNFSEVRSEHLKRHLIEAAININEHADC